MNSLIGIKKMQGQKFLENGARIPVTFIDVAGNTVVAHRTQDKNNYQAVQIGVGTKKNATKAELGHAKGAKKDTAPKFLKEVKLSDETLPELGVALNPSEVFAPGDIIDVSGVSKGKGFAGGVKRHHFRGGPKTHGQSDRHRAPGAIGQGTTPGRVYKGKRMAGRMGNENVTVRNLEVMEVTNDGVLIVKGLIPGILNSLIVIKKVGTDTKFVPLWKEPEAVSDTQPQDVEEKNEEPRQDEAPAEEQQAQAPQEAAQEEPESKPAEPQVEENNEEVKDAK